MMSNLNHDINTQIADVDNKTDANNEAPNPFKTKP
jgi:hypothetical protein